MKGNERELKKKPKKIAHSGREFRRPEVLFWGKSHAPDSNFVVPTTYTPPHPGACFFRWFPFDFGSAARSTSPPAAERLTAGPWKFGVLGILAVWLEPWLLCPKLPALGMKGN